MITGKNKFKILIDISCECTCKFDERKCNSNQKWNNDKCRCECKKHNICNLINSVTKNSYGYDEKQMKIKLDSDDKLSLNKTIEIHSMIIVARVVFHKNNKYYPQVFLDECLYKS